MGLSPSANVALAAAADTECVTAANSRANLHQARQLTDASRTAVVRNVRSINIWYSLDRWSRCLTTLDQAASDLTSSDTITVAQYSSLLTDSDSGMCLNRYSSALGIDRAAQIRLYSTIAGENITTFGNLAQAESYSLLLRLFSSNKFDPPVSCLCSGCPACADTRMDVCKLTSHLVAERGV